MDIKLIQQQLIKFGYPINADGAIGIRTTAAIKAFQEKNKLEVDGIIGPKTLAALFPIDKTAPISKILKIRAMEIALSKEGVREATGKNDGPEVEMYLKSVGLGKGFSWCAAFIYWCYEQAAKELGIVNPVFKTAGVLAHWNSGKGLHTNAPQVGDIFIMDFGGGEGHTGIVTKVANGRVDTIEGNTNSQNSREGNGIYQRNRPISGMKGFIRYDV